MTIIIVCKLNDTNSISRQKRDAEWNTGNKTKQKHVISLNWFPSLYKSGLLNGCRKDVLWTLDIVLMALQTNFLIFITLVFMTSLGLQLRGNCCQVLVIFPSYLVLFLLLLLSLCVSDVHVIIGLLWCIYVY